MRKDTYKELLFQVIVHLVVFVFYSFDRNQPHIELYKFVSFINYAITAAIFNYICLPIFYKRKNLFIGFAMICGLILLSALLEEFVLERIYFTGKRAETIRMVWAFIDIIPVVAILTGAKFGWDALIKQTEVDRLEEAIKDSELQFLKSQINPHFLFNNINNLYSYALEGSKKTPEIILELSGLLRYMLYECKEKFVSLNKELEQLKNFVNLNELQIEERGDVRLRIDKIEGNYSIAPLILIVFVENAFKHSQSSQSEDIFIDISISVSNDGELHFQCANSYQEMSNNDTLDNGIGLKNVKKRLELIYPKAHTLKIEDGNGKYKVEFFVNLKQNKIQ